MKLDTRYSVEVTESIYDPDKEILDLDQLVDNIEWDDDFSFLKVVDFKYEEGSKLCTLVIMRGFAE